MTVRDLLEHVESPYRYDYAFYGIGTDLNKIREPYPYFDIGRRYDYNNDVIEALLDYEIEDFSIDKGLVFVFEINLIAKGI